MTANEARDVLCKVARPRLVRVDGGKFRFDEPDDETVANAIATLRLLRKSFGQAGREFGIV